MMSKTASERRAVAVLGLVSVFAYAHAGMTLLFPHGMPRLPAPVAHSTVAENRPLSVQAFRADVDKYSKNNLMVVVLRRNGCDICPDVMSALDGARLRLIRKTGGGFAVYELNAEQNPEVAALLRQRNPQADARLHVLYNGEKIYESLGITDNAQHLAESLEMVQALAYGEVSSYDKYQPANIFDAPLPTALTP